MSERPLECSGCQRDIKTIYKEIAGNAITTTCMCAECPILREKLGQPPSAFQSTATPGLCCNQCRTTVDTLLTEGLLGCKECYTVFEALITDELMHQEGLPHRLITALETNRRAPLHCGSTPQPVEEVALSTKLKEMNEALNEALKKENYEEAAYLRDQIKNLMDQ